MIRCSSVILAVGEAVDRDFCAASGLSVKENGVLDVNRYTLETSREKFYAGGDLVTGASNISNAMGYGKEAARHIDAPPQRAVAVRRDPAEVRLRSAAAGPRSWPTPPGARPAGRSPAPDLRRGDAEPSRPRKPRARPPAACAATSAKPAATPPPISKEKPPCLLKSPCESMANCAPPPRVRPSSRSPRPTANAIPSLCRLVGVSSPGSCRLCLVEVGGADRLLPACTTPAQRGMAVTTIRTA